MLIREGEHRTLAIDAKLAGVLAAIAGAVNAAAFQATGFFSANMTGNLSAMSDALGLGKIGPAGIFGALLISFVLGAFASGVLIEAGRRRKIRAI